MPYTHRRYLYAETSIVCIPRGEGGGLVLKSLSTREQYRRQSIALRFRIISGEQSRSFTDVRRGEKRRKKLSATSFPVSSQPIPHDLVPPTAATRVWDKKHVCYTEDLYSVHARRRRRGGPHLLVHLFYSRHLLLAGTKYESARSQSISGNFSCFFFLYFKKTPFSV